MTESPPPADTPTPPPEPPSPGEQPQRRRRLIWPWVAGGVAVLVIVGVAATALVAGGRDRWHGARGYSPESAALELAVADAGGIDVLADDPGADEGGPGAGRDERWRDGPGHRGGLLDRLGDDTLLVGSVAGVANGTLTVTRDGGGEKAVTTDDRTRVRGAGNSAVGDLTAGERVVVRVGTDNKAIGVLGLRPHVAGTVTALDGDRATVVRGSGLSQVVDVSAVAQKPAVGDLIAAVGTLADDGTTLKAETVRVLPKTQ